MIYFQAALLVGGVLMTLYFSIEAIDHLCQLLKKDKG
jgi:TRAP-type C4-dicarboxylate transport system permease small subunit